MKWLERRLRRFFNRIYLRSLQPQVVRTVQDALHLPPQGAILFLRQDRIGDVLISTPVMHAVRKRFPEAHIGVVLSTNNIAVSTPLREIVNTVHVYRKSLLGFLRLVLQLRQRKYDVVVDLMDNPSTTSSLLVSFSNAPYRIGIEKQNAGVYTHVVPLLDRASVHISKRIAQLLLPFGIDPHRQNLQPTYPVTTEEKNAAYRRLGIDRGMQRFRVGVNASGSDRGRRYPPEVVAEIITHLKQKYSRVDFYLFSDPKNSDWTQRVSSAAPALVVPPTPSFHDAAVCWSVMDVMWTPDTSIVHLASAWKIPVLVLYVFNNPDLMPWYPVHTHYEVLHTTAPSIAAIAKDDIVRALERLFAYCSFPME